MRQGVGEILKNFSKLLPFQRGVCLWNQFQEKPCHLFKKIALSDIMGRLGAGRPLG